MSRIMRAGAISTVLDSTQWKKLDKLIFTAFLDFSKAKILKIAFLKSSTKHGLSPHLFFVFYLKFFSLVWMFIFHYCIQYFNKTNYKMCCVINQNARKKFISFNTTCGSLSHLIYGSKFLKKSSLSFYYLSKKILILKDLYIFKL